MAQWRLAAVALEHVRAVEIRNANLARVAEDLEDACVASAGARAAMQTSGLIEQQRIFHTRGDA